jgi:hypothetical protein
MSSELSIRNFFRGTRKVEPSLVDFAQVFQGGENKADVSERMNSLQRKKVILAVPTASVNDTFQ